MEPYDFAEFSYFRVTNLLTPKVAMVSPLGEIRGPSFKEGEPHFIITTTLRTGSGKFEKFDNKVVSFLTNGDKWYKIGLVLPELVPACECAAVRDSGQRIQHPETGEELPLPIFINFWFYADFFFSRYKIPGAWQTLGPEAFENRKSQRDQWLNFWEANPNTDPLNRAVMMENWISKEDKELIDEHIAKHIEVLDYGKKGELP